MADIAGKATSRPRQIAGERYHYAVGNGKRTALALAFLVLLPFFASLPVMIYQRLEHGNTIDIWQLLFFGLCLCIVVGLLAVQLTYAVRARLTLGERAFAFTLPRGSGAAAMLHYARQTIPYSEIAEIELRREIFGGSIMPVVLQGAHVITKKGFDVLLGYVSESNADDAFPFNTIAHQIAERANVRLIEEPGIWRTLHSKTQAKAAGLIAGDAHLVEPAEIERLNRNHRRFGLAVINVVLAIVLVGIAMDITDVRRNASIAAVQAPAADAGAAKPGAAEPGRGTD